MPRPRTRTLRCSHPLSRPRRHRRAGAQDRGRGPRGQAGGRHGQDPRGQDRGGVVGRGPRQGRPPRARSRLGHLQRRHRDHRHSRHRHRTRALRPAHPPRGQPTRLRRGSPPGRPRRRRFVDLELRRRALPRRPPDRRHLPCQGPSLRGRKGHLRERQRDRRAMGRKATPGTRRGPRRRHDRRTAQPCRNLRGSSQRRRVWLLPQPPAHELPEVPRHGPGVATGVEGGCTSAPASSRAACAGPSTAQTPSSPCAAPSRATASTTSGNDDPDQNHKAHKPDVHPVHEDAGANSRSHGVEGCTGSVFGHSRTVRIHPPPLPTSPVRGEVFAVPRRRCYSPHGHRAEKVFQGRTLRWRDGWTARSRW